MNLLSLTLLLAMSLKMKNKNMVLFYNLFFYYNFLFVSIFCDFLRFSSGIGFNENYKLDNGIYYLSGILLVDPASIYLCLAILYSVKFPLQTTIKAIWGHHKSHHSLVAFMANTVFTHHQASVTTILESLFYLAHQK